jgi:hypothetical protein
VAKIKNREADQAAPGPLDGMRDKLSPEEIEEKIERDRDMKRILWAVGPIVIFFVLLWLIQQFWLFQE